MAVTPELVRNPFAMNGDKGVTAPPQSSPDGWVNFTDGYTTAYELALDKGNPQAKPVGRLVQNYLFNQMSMTTKAWQQMSFAPWYSNMPNGYELGAWVYTSDGSGRPQAYRSSIANNFNDPKSLIGWERLMMPSEMFDNIPMPSGGSLTSALNLTAGANFETLGRGTYVCSTDAIANACLNVPTAIGEAQPRAGIYEVMVGAANIKFVRYHDRLGNSFNRGQNVSWTPWRQEVKIDDLQRGAPLNATMTGSAATIILTTTPTFTPVNGTRIGFRSTANISANATVSLNGSSAVDLYAPSGTRILAGGIVSGQEVVLQYSLTNARWVVVSPMARQQGLEATNDGQYPTLGQVKQMTGAIDLEWNSIRNKPRVLVWGDTILYGLNVLTRSMKLVPASNSGENAADYAWDFATVGNDGGLLAIRPASGINQFTIGPISGIAGATHIATSIATFRADNGLQVRAGTTGFGLRFLNATGLAQWDATANSNGELVFSRNGGTHMTLNSAGRLILSTRPQFNGANPYDTLNLGVAGAVQAFAAKHSQPGWLYCDGATYLRADYPELFAIIGTTYGSTGATNFRVPDMRGRFARGWSDGLTTIDAGRALGSFQVNGYASHTHDITVTIAGEHFHSVALTAASAGAHIHSATSGSGVSGNHQHPIGVSIDAGGNHAHGGTTTVNGEHQHWVKEGHADGRVVPGAGEILTSGDDYTTTVAYNSTTSAGGGHYHQFTTDINGYHTHGVSASIGFAGDHNHVITTTINSNGAHTHAVNGNTGSNGAHTHAASASASGSGTETRPDNIAMPYYIATGRT